METENENPRLVGETWSFFRSFLSSVDEGTAYQYRTHFVKFLEWLDTDTQELYTTHRDNLSSGEPIRRMWLGRKITEYQEYLRDEKGHRLSSGKATTTVLMVQKAVIAFFRSVGINDIPLNGGIKVGVDSVPNITKAQLRELLRISGSFRNIALINFIKDSGLRVGDIARTTIRMVRPILDDPKLDFFNFEIEQEKTDNSAFPVIGPETCKALREWIEWRRDHGISTEDSDPLFCLIKGQSAYTTKDGKEVTGKRRGDSMTGGSISVVFGYLVRKSKLPPAEGETKKPSAHSCRKYHRTNLEWAGCPTSWINVFQGRTGEGSGQIYTRPNPAQLIEIYREHYKGLSLETNLDTEDLNERVTELERVNQYLWEVIDGNSNVTPEFLKSRIKSDGLDITDELRQGYSIKESQEIVRDKLSKKEEKDKEKQIKELQEQLKKMQEALAKLTGDQR